MRYLIALLAFGGMFVSGLALRVHYQDPSAAPPCAVTEKFDCGAVNHSRFAVFPPRGFDEDPNSKGHVPVALIGIVGYALMAGLALWGRLWVVLQLAQIGFFCAGLLTYLEAYVLEKWCIYCLWSQGIVATILLVTAGTLLVRWRQQRRPGNPAHAEALNSRTGELFGDR
jgi:vitamin-K-epoxide reductase (warfarin-sensitive)